ncbi:Protein CBG23676 [Caenorhabditis briggsae]|uniref:Protein CBG23676 n=1 Tax=Caenorhabditis briggsae TaxID=6238 RepID=A8WJ24_CAEBR|nr:Protein CBG23676 [Caenorhabditis briggsae]CAP20468.2 Protein CBG23676 [Caenorhabditis briggsae]
MNRIDALKEAGRSLNEIAEQSERSKTTVTAYLKNREVRRKKAEGVLTENQKEEILRLKGESLRKIKMTDIVDAMTEDPEEDDNEEDVDLEVVDRPVASGAKGADDYEETDDDDDDVQDEQRIGDVQRRGSKEDVTDFQISRSYDPEFAERVEAEGSPAGEADWMDEYEEDDDLEVGDVRRGFNEDVDDIETSRCSEPAKAVREQPEVAEGSDEYEEDDDDEDVRDERRIGEFPAWVGRNEDVDDFVSPTKNLSVEAIKEEPEVMDGSRASDSDGSDVYEETDDEDVSNIRSEQKDVGVRQGGEEKKDSEDPKIQEPEVEEMEVDVAQEASEDVKNQPELVRLGGRTDVGNWSRDQVQSWADQFLSPEQSVDFQKMKLTGAGLLHFLFNHQPPEGLEDVLQIIKTHLRPIADLESSSDGKQRHRNWVQKLPVLHELHLPLLYSCKEVRKALSRWSDDPFLRMVSGIFDRTTNSARDWRATLDHEYHTGHHDIRFVFQGLMKNIELRSTDGVVWSTRDYTFLTIQNGSFNNSLRVAYSPMVSGECSKCGSVVQKITRVEAQQAQYHFLMISGTISDINSESEVAMFGHQWRIRGFAERVMLGAVGHFVSWFRNLDHWYLVDDEQSKDMGHQAVNFTNRNIMILVFEKVL